MTSQSAIQAVLADQIDVRGKSVGMVVGMVSPEGRPVVSHGATVQGGPVPDADVAFELASLTKVFTATLLAEMVGKGEVSLDDSVARHMPAECKMPTWNGQAITLRDLATHTSGLPPQPPDVPTLDDPRLATYSVDQLFHACSNFQLTRPIGSQWEYGNWDFAVLGHVLAHRARVDFETLVEQRITGPLGMTSTALQRTGSMRLATVHNADREPLSRLALGAIEPAGGMVSSANDMLTFASALLGLGPSPFTGVLETMVGTRRPMRPSLGRMLRDNWPLMLRMILSPPTAADRPVRYFSGAESGLAWFILKQGTREMVVHDGGAPSCSASLAIDPVTRTAVIVLSNTGINIHDVSRHLLWPDYPLSRTRHEVRPPVAELTRYVGTYQIPKGPAFRIKPGRDRLTIAFPVVGDLVFRAESSDTFFVPEMDFEFRFTAHGPVREVIVRPGRSQPSVPVPRVA